MEGLGGGVHMKVAGDGGVGGGGGTHEGGWRWRGWGGTHEGGWRWRGWGGGYT